MTAVLKPIVVDVDDFAAQFQPIVNRLDLTAPFDFGEGGCLFAGAGKELRYVLTQRPRTIWTLLEGDDGRTFIQSGFHIVNRLGYFVARTPRSSDAPVFVSLDDG